MSELNVSLILRLVDQLSGPAKIAAASLAAFGAGAKQLGRESTAAVTAVNALGTAAQATGRALGEEAKATREVARDATSAKVGLVGLTGAADSLGTAAQATGRALGEEAKVTREAATEANSAKVGFVGLTGAADSLGTAAQSAGRALGDSARVTREASNDNERLARSTTRVADVAAASARKFTLLERSQFRAAAAGRKLGSGWGQLNTDLGNLALGGLAAQTLSQTGRAATAPFSKSVSTARDFNLGMTGIGITADLSDRQLEPVRTTIFDTANRFGMSNERTQAVFGAVLNEGAYRSSSDLIAAGRSVAGYQKLAEVGGDPLDDAQTGALTSALAFNLGAPARGLDAYLARAFRSSQLGGVRAGAVAKALPEQLGILKGFDAGDDRNYASLLAANQVVKHAAGDSDQAVIYTKDFLASLAQQHTLKRFGESNINLQEVISQAKKKGVPVIDAVVDAVAGVMDKKLLESHDDKSIEQFLIGKLLINQQGATALRALVQHRDEFHDMQKKIASNDSLPSYQGGLDRVSKTDAAAYQRYQNSINRMGIATGTILAPAARVAANLLGGLASAMTNVEEKGGPLAKAGVFIAAGLGAVAGATGAIASAVVGIAGPFVVFRGLFRMLPTAAEGARAGLLARSIGEVGRAAGWVGRIGPVLGRVVG